jgi:hypothetical protein
MQLRWAVALWLATFAVPAAAGMPVSQTMKCPVGGETFTYTTTASYSTWGYRPDGKPYGSWEFPLALPKCPNGLVVFDEFSKDEIRKLAALIESAEYREMRDAETGYYLASWLMKGLGRDPIDVAWMMVQASWQADGRPELKARYQALYVDQIRNLPKSEDEITGLFMQGRAVNGLRELKRFEEAKALLASLSLAPLDVPIPEERVVGTTPSGLGRQIANYEEIREAERKRGFLEYFKQLAQLVEAGDSSSEPLRMIPAREAAARCASPDAALSAPDKEYCASAEIQRLTAPTAD